MAIGSRSGMGRPPMCFSCLQKQTAIRYAASLILGDTESECLDRRSIGIGLESGLALYTWTQATGIRMPS